MGNAGLAVLGLAAGTLAAAAVLAEGQQALRGTLLPTAPLE
jgi:hypothetical protein